MGACRYKTREGITILITAGLKKYAHNAGAMGCGVAGTDRFAAAPEVFRPTDIYSNPRRGILPNAHRR